MGGSLREASVAHRCSQNPPTQLCRSPQMRTPPSFTEPLSSHGNRPFTGVLAACGTSQDPCGGTCSSAPGKPRPQARGSPQQTMPPHGGGTGREEACLDAALTASRRMGGKGVDRPGGQGDSATPSPTKQGAGHAVCSPERSMLVGLGSDSRSSPLLLCEL